jgi:hypothetical protein
MGKSYTFIGGIVAAGITVLIVVWVLQSRGGSDSGLSPLFHVPQLASSTQATTPQSTNEGSLVTTSGVEHWYSNTALKFSFQLPDGFEAPEIDTGAKGVYGVWVHNDAGAQLVVLINPIAEGSSISAAGIKDNLPGVAVYDVQDTFIGTVVHAVKFRNNSDEWGGDGVSVWAAYNGHVYQISAARKDQDLLNFVITHWFFAPPQPPRPKK